jgi:hypothetical protein
MTTAIENAMNLAASINAINKLPTPISEASYTPSLISNPMTILDKLHALAPRNEFFAANAIFTSLGYSIVNHLLWNQRKSQAKASIPVPTIDGLNDGYGREEETRATEDAMHDHGLEALPSLTITSEIIGAYKTMWARQKRSPFATDFPVREPHEILHELQTNKRAADVDTVYREVIERLANPGVARALKAATETTRARLEPLEKNKHEVEQNFVLGEIQATRRCELTDDIWDTIPLWVQYKLVKSVHNQIIKAAAFASVKADSEVEFDLIELANDVQLELEAAARSPEVKLAFALERLVDKHVLA